MALHLYLLRRRKLDSDALLTLVDNLQDRERICDVLPFTFRAEMRCQIYGVICVCNEIYLTWYIFPIILKLFQAMALL